MAIYRGPGGSGDAVNDSSSETRLAVEARDAALAAQAAAEAAQAAAETAETNAQTAETNAETAETNAETAATNAASSASSASSSASAASTSATNAASSASSASTSATNAASSASSASTSASNASTSATNAASSASSASSSATSAASSASSASTSASTATTKASEASTSATNAASSASSASSSASTATTQAGIATTKASEASTSATNAASSASSASTSATNAASSASSASTSATNASNSATAASSAQSAAEAARDATLAAYDSFDDRYLGAKTSDPTLDNDGNALVAGALYFNSTDGVMKLYTGSIWTAAYVSGAGVLLQANNLSDLNNVASARTNLGLGTAATTAATDYATAAQGAKADTALQPATIGVSVQGYDADLDAIAALSGTSGLLKKTAANTWSLDTTSYLSGTVGVANGGTGLTSLTAGYIPFGNGTSAFGNSTNLFWDSANARLGIGTSSPSAKLDVAGVSGSIGLRVATVGGGTGANIYFGYNTSNAGYLGYSDATGNMTLMHTLAYPLIFGTNNTERMRIDSSGNVGIGTSSPQDRLQVTGSTSTTQVLLATTYGGSTNNYNRGLKIQRAGYGSSGAWQMYGLVTDYSNGYLHIGFQSSVANDYQFTDAGFTKFATFDTSGNLGIGTSSPSARIHSSSADGTYQLGVSGTTKGVRFVADSTQMQITGVDNTFSASYQPLQIGGSYLAFATSGTTERMRIDSAGRVAIATQTAESNLTVYGTSTAPSATTLSSGTLNIKGSSTLRLLIGTDPASPYGAWLQTTDGAGAGYPINLNPLGGNVGIGTSSPYSNAAFTTLAVGGTASAKTGLISLVTSAGTDSAHIDVYNSQLRISTNGTTNPVVFYTGGSVTEAMRIDSSGNLLFNSGYGSAATAYGCRAWVNFNGTGTVAIRSSGNVSSITDNATGTYTVNLSTAMPDTNYSVVDNNNNGTSNSTGSAIRGGSSRPLTTSTCQVFTYGNDVSSTFSDADVVCVSIFR